VPDLRPLRGLRYDPVAVPDLAAVICPPYDVISPGEREILAARHPANAVHVELPESYEGAARLFAAWQADGTLQRDEQPQLYVYEQRYTRADGSAARARGFMCRLRLAELMPGGDVRAHEHTMAGPKEDRYQLLRAVRANLSPVVLLYEARHDGEPGVDVDGLLDVLGSGAPDIDAVDDAGVRHLAWLADPALSGSSALLHAAGSVPLTIADGHHRYQTALRYCAEAGGPGADYVLALLVEARTGGLSVLATHRLIRGVDGARVLAAAGELFAIEPAASAEELLADVPRGAIGLWTRHGGGRLRPRADRIESLLPDSAPPALRALDVTILNAAYPSLLGAGADQLTAADRIAYTKDAGEAIAAVEAGAADVAFVLAPTPVAAVLDVAAAGEVMPPKSTYFYPKPATGLVFNVLDA
jgi:uncharacterized protein (DUF1015 family)